MHIQQYLRTLILFQKENKKVRENKIKSAMNLIKV